MRYEPALSAREWAKGTPGVYGWDDGSVFVDWRRQEPDVERPHAVIAALNAALPDDDPRKITRDWVTELRQEADRADYADRTGDNAGMSVMSADLMRRMANALESYLPPEAG